MLPVNNQLTMSSREIAELTGKRHDHVLRDIQKMIDNPKLGFQAQQGFYSPIGQSRAYKEYRLPRRSSDLLVMSYSVEIQAKVYDRWQELENKQPEAPQLPQTYLEALEQLVEKEKKLIEQAPKVAFVDNLVDRTGLMNATQVGQPHGLSAVKLNKTLDEFNVYNKAVKRGRAFQQWFIDKGYGEMKQTDAGFPQALFTNAGAVWIHEKLTVEGVI